MGVVSRAGSCSYCGIALPLLVLGNGWFGVGLGDAWAAVLGDSPLPFAPRLLPFDVLAVILATVLPLPLAVFVVSLPMTGSDAMREAKKKAE